MRCQSAAGEVGHGAPQAGGGRGCF
jgi:hypothetical protein